MITQVTDFFLNLDLPAALIGAIAGFLLNYLGRAYRVRRERHRQSIEGQIEWFRDLRSVARNIAMSCKTTRGFATMYDIDEQTLEEGGDVLKDRLQNNRDVAFKKQTTDMEALYEELRKHISITDADLDDNDIEKLDSLLFHTFWQSIQVFRVMGDATPPAEKHAEAVVELCDKKIEELEEELPFWRCILSGLRPRLR